MVGEGNMKELKKDGISLLVTILLAVVLVVWTYNFWNWDINVPIAWFGDAITDLGSLSMAQKAIRGDGVYIAHTAATPLAAEMNYQIVDGSLHFLIMKALSIFFRTPGVLMNIYYLFTYPASASVMFFVLRKLNINRWISVWVSIVYAFLPGHFYRNVSHMAIGSSFTLPLVCLGTVWLLEENLGRKQYFNHEIKDIGQLLHSVCTKNMLLAILGSILLGLSSLYHCCFSMMVHAVTAILSYFETQKKRNLFYGCLLLVTDFLVAAFCVGLPAILSDGRTMNTIGSVRNISDVNMYSLKISQLILPIQKHRLNLFNNIRKYYDASFVQTENATSSLGLTLSIALIISIFCALFYGINKTIVNLGKINLALLCISMIGGLSELAAMLFSYIRCYNRMSFFIAAFSSIALAYIVNGFYKKYQCKIRKTGWLVAIIVGIGFALYDQTFEELALTKEYSQTTAQMWSRMESFFKEIEITDKDILMYPSIYSDEYQERLEFKYENMTPYIHSETAIYSNGYIKGSQTDLWLQALENYSDEDKVKIAIGAGFDGIILYRDGFKDIERFNEIDKSFETILGNRKMLEEEGWVYYSLKDYKENLGAYANEQTKVICMDIVEAYNYLEYNLGQRLDFVNRDFQDDFMSGFSYKEINGYWTLGNESAMGLKIQDEYFGDLQLHIEFSLIYTGEQHVCVYADKELVWEGDIASGASLDCLIPREMISDNELNLVFKFPGAVSPLEYEERPDDRILAVMFANMTLSDTGNNIQPSNSNDAIRMLEDMWRQ